MPSARAADALDQPRLAGAERHRVGDLRVRDAEPRHACEELPRVLDARQHGGRVPRKPIARAQPRQQRQPRFETGARNQQAPLRREPPQRAQQRPLSETAAAPRRHGLGDVGGFDHVAVGEPVERDDARPRIVRRAPGGLRERTRGHADDRQGLSPHQQQSTRAMR